MKTKYKNCKIEVKREKCLAGYYLIYFNIFTEDGFCIVDRFTESEDSIDTIVESCKNIVNDYLEHPEDYE